MNHLQLVPAPAINPTDMTTEQLLEKINTLEIKASVYSESDWEAYNRVDAEIKNLDKILLDRYNKENETWLQNHPIGNDIA